MPEIDARRSQALREAQAEISRNREELIHAGLALRAKLHEIVEWRTWYRRAPMLWLGGALLGGYLVGRPRPSRSRR